MPRADLASYIARWLEKARVDVGTARTLIREQGETAAWAGCFHAQQAAEKYMKAAIATTGIEPPYTHNLVNLESQLPDSIKFPATIDLGLLTTYAASTRYVLSEMPEDPDPTWADAQDALTWAEAIAKAVETWVVESGLGR